MTETADEPTVAIEGQGVPDDRPRDRGDRQRSDAHHERVQGVLGTDEAGVEEAERRRHQQHQRGGKHPGGVAHVHLRRHHAPTGARRCEELPPVRMRTTCSSPTTKILPSLTSPVRRHHTAPRSSVRRTRRTPRSRTAPCRPCRRARSCRGRSPRGPTRRAPALDSLRTPALPRDTAPPALRWPSGRTIPITSFMGTQRVGATPERLWPGGGNPSRSFVRGSRSGACHSEVA